jgi:hypothetical protein
LSKILRFEGAIADWAGRVTNADSGFKKLRKAKAKRNWVVFLRKRKFIGIENAAKGSMLSSTCKRF